MLVQQYHYQLPLQKWLPDLPVSPLCRASEKTGRYLAVVASVFMQRSTVSRFVNFPTSIFEVDFCISGTNKKRDKNLKKSLIVVVGIPTRVQILRQEFGRKLTLRVGR